ncbi:hypothetical protein [Aquihabitans sp. McL0605]|uniref:hypothetical protein n=1 Tax=Aquihabitans sp. McL0605 TaxID=3415671 RepID=UPI003CF3AF17
MGTIVTGMVVGLVKRGVTVELGSAEGQLDRSRYGAADQLDEAVYGDALTVEVISNEGGQIGLSRVAIDRSLRQPRPRSGRLEHRDGGLVLVPADGAEPFPVVVLDCRDPSALERQDRTWLVGAPVKGRQFVLAAEG